MDIIKDLYAVFCKSKHIDYVKLLNSPSSYHTSYQPLSERDFTSSSFSIGSCTSVSRLISVCVSACACTISSCKITYKVNCCIQITRDITSASSSVGSCTSESKWVENY